MLANRTKGRLSAIFAATVLAAFVMFGAPASADIYEVSDVAVDATAASAAEARDLALANGQREAFYRLLQRLTPSAYHDQFPNLNASTVATYVRDFSVANEQTSSVRYLARLNVRFQEQDIRILLEEFGIPFTETASRPVVVLPVLSRAGASILWRDPNPWRIAWSQATLPSLPVPMMMPVGDLDDISGISAQDAIGTNPAPLDRIAQRYGAGAVTVAHATIATLGPPHVEITLTRRDIGTVADTVVTRVEALPAESIEQVLTRAVDAAIATIEESWKNQTVMRFDRGGILAVNVPLSALDHWINVRSRLSQIAVVERSDLILLSRDEALLNIHYIGEVSQLARALAQSDMTLRENEGVWTLLTPETRSSLVQ